MRNALFVICFLLFSAMACNLEYEEDMTFADETMFAEENAGKGQDIFTKAAEDCYVRITCSDGTTKSCYGTYGQCSASGSGYGSVTCNGSTKYCPAPPPPPPSECVWNAYCSNSNDCGEGYCGFDNRCDCIIP